MERKTDRQRKDKDLTVRDGIMSQPRFPRAMYRELKGAAAAEGLAVTAYIRRVVYLALDARKERKSNGDRK